jgi:hypothetical protein
MTLILWMAVQASAAPGAVPVAPVEFDLGAVRPVETDTGLLRRCRGTPDEIVVCGRRRGGDYPMEEMARRYRQEPLKAEAGIGGGATARAYVEQVELSPGQVSKRAMFGIKLPF